MPGFTGEIYWPFLCNRYASGTIVTGGSALVSNSSDSAQTELGTCGTCSSTSAHIEIVSLLREQGIKRHSKEFQDGPAGVLSSMGKMHTNKKKSQE